MIRQRYSFILLLFTVMSLSACSSAGPEPTKTFTITPTTAPIPTATATPDPCAPENITNELERVNGLMRQFDDASLVASNTPFEQLNPAIAELQRIRRHADNLRVPSCLTRLKGYQLAHMNAVIDTLLGFYKGADAATLTENIALARQYHDQYSLALAQLLGLTMTPTATAVLTPTP